MNTTLILIGIALVLGIAALFAVPSSVEPEIFSDQGEIFFPEFADPFACQSLEVYEPDLDAAEVKPFKVVFEDGLYRIPSHHGYPADAKERMANAAASLIGLMKDKIRSDRVEDRAAFGVEDPLDAATPLENRGKRIVMKDNAGRTLADIIVGKGLEPGDGMGGAVNTRDWAYLREPDSKRIYAVNLRISPESYGELLKDISTKFSEWIDTDLLHLERGEVKELFLHNYTVDETTRSIQAGEDLLLEKGEEDKWTLEELAEEEQVNDTKVTDMLRTLDNLTIAGVRPKPKQLTMGSLVSKGFFVDQNGALFGNEGQLEVTTDKGVKYHLFFGEVLFGSGAAVTAGIDQEEDSGEEKDEEEAESVENRYLYVSAALDSSLEQGLKRAREEAEEEQKQKEAEKAEKEKAEAEEGEDVEEEPKKEEEKTEKQKEVERLEKKLEEAKAKVEELNLRFDKWYYVITGDSFSKLHLSRAQLVELKVPDTSSIGEQPETEKEPIERPSGLAYVELDYGSGQSAADGDLVKVLYTGWLKDGTEFDSNQDKENPFSLTLGKGEVIKGWEEGLKGMRPGGKRKLIIPPDLGYGDADKGTIPPNSFLIFDVELLEVIKPEMEEGEESPDENK